MKPPYSLKLLHAKEREILPISLSSARKKSLLTMLFESGAGSARVSSASSTISRSFESFERMLDFLTEIIFEIFSSSSLIGSSSTFSPKAFSSPFFVNNIELPQ